MIPKKALNLVGQDYQCYKGKFSHLTRLDISIFEVLISCGGANRRHLSNVLNRSQSQISKRLKIWKKLGVISQIGLNPKVAYIKKSFHSDVKRLLEAYRFGKNNAVYSVHNLFFITEINEIPEKLRRHLLKNGWNSRNRKNVPSIITEVEGVTVIFEKASHSWKAQFLTKCLGETPAITFDLAIQKVNTVKDKLRYKYPGLKFGGREDFMTLHRLHVAFLLEPFTVTAYLLGIQSKFSSLESSWLPEFELKGVNAISAMSKIHKMRQLILEENLTELEFSKIIEHAKSCPNFKNLKNNSH